MNDKELYLANLTALAECVARGVSQETVYQLAYEAGIDRQDIESLYKQAA
jgi:hypothetical protein